MMSITLREAYTNYPVPSDGEATAFGMYLFAEVMHPDDGRLITAIRHTSDDDTAWSYFDTVNETAAMQQYIDDFTALLGEPDNDDLNHLKEMTDALKATL